MSAPPERRAPLTYDRAREAARTLSAVVVGDHPVGTGDHPGAVYARRLAARKLGDLYDETGGLAEVLEAAAVIDGPGLRIVNTDPDPFRGPLVEMLERTLGPDALPEFGRFLDETIARLADAEGEVHP